MELIKGCVLSKMAISVVCLLSSFNLHAIDYEVWATDQSNSVSGASVGSDGGYIYIWERPEIESFYVANPGTGSGPVPIGCDYDVWPNGQARTTYTGIAGAAGPCDIHKIFPDTLVASNGAGTLGALGSLGRMHSISLDPQNQYYSVNFSAPGKAYVGIMDGQTKEAVALFRLTDTNAQAVTDTSAPTSSWNIDGSALVIANQEGLILERIKITRTLSGGISAAQYDRSAVLAVSDLNGNVIDTAYYFTGTNGTGDRTMGSLVTSSISGSYDLSSFGSFDGRYISNGNTYCMENGCVAQGGDVGALITDVGRPDNTIQCAYVTSDNKAMVRFDGGGLIVADIDTSPMSVVGGYSNNLMHGSGGCVVEVAGDVYLNSGVSSSDTGRLKSTFGFFKINIAAFDNGNPGGMSPHTENLPAPKAIGIDGENTQGFGNTTGLGGLLDFGTSGTVTEKFTGQNPDTSTRRDGHGMTVTTTDSFIHVVDRIQNNITAIRIASDGFSTYSIRGGAGLGCDANSVGNGVSANDPTGGMMAADPNGRALFVALHGPIPVTSTHSSQGSCPGVGIITLDKQKFPAIGNPDEAGTMNHVIRTSNNPTLGTGPDNAPAHVYVETAVGNGILAGDNYTGDEHSDIHGISVRIQAP